MVVLAVISATFGGLYVTTQGDLEDTKSDLSSLKDNYEDLLESKNQVENELNSTENELAEAENRLESLQKSAPDSALPEADELPGSIQWEEEWTRVTTSPEVVPYKLGDSYELVKWGFEKASKKSFDSWEGNTYVSLDFTVVEFSDASGAKNSFESLKTNYEQEGKYPDYKTVEKYSVDLGDEAAGFFTVEE